MPSCELCGRSMKGSGRSVVIEGASMIVCPQCASKFAGSTTTETRSSSPGPKQRPIWAGGHDPQADTRPHRSAPAPKMRAKPKPKRPGILLDEMELIEDYADAIREARQKLNLSQEELAQRVGERVSTLQAVEAGRQKPTEKTIRGLERELEISLLEAVGPVPLKTSKSSSGKGTPTLGDRVVVKRKMSQKARRTDAQTK